MTEEITWGLPNKQTNSRKQERFVDAVITMTAITKEGVSRKFSFNKAAKELLGLVGKESYIQVGFGTDKIFIKNIGAITEDNEVPSGAFLLANNMTIADKGTFNFIIKNFQLDETIENHLHLASIEGKPFVEVSMITSDNVSGQEPLLEEVLETINETPVVEEVVSVVKGSLNESISESEPTHVTEEIWEDEPVTNAKAVKFAIDNTEEEVIESEIESELEITFNPEVSTDEPTTSAPDLGDDW